MIYGKKPYRNPEVDKEAYLAWYEEGTLLRAAKRMEEKGIISAQKRPFTPDGVRKAAVRHMINNYDEVRAELLRLYSSNGYTIEDSKIDHFMIRMAVATLNNPDRVRYWMAEHGLMEKYSGYIESLIAI
jgi:hypothetical protein